MENTPAKIFELRQHTHHIHNWLLAWENGLVSWKDCLLKIHDALVTDCIYKTSAFDLGYPKSREFYECKLPTTPITASEMLLAERREVIDQQSIIASIDKTVNIWYKIIDSAADKVHSSTPAPIMYADGRLEMKYDFPDSELSRQTQRG